MSWEQAGSPDFLHVPHHPLGSACVGTIRCSKSSKGRNILEVSTPSLLKEEWDCCLLEPFS